MELRTVQVAQFDDWQLLSILFYFRTPDTNLRVIGSRHKQMLSKMYLATTLTLSLGLSFVASEEKPRYLWSSCDDSASSNLYNTKLEVENIFNNETIRMADYAGQVKVIFIFGEIT